MSSVKTLPRDSENRLLCECENCGYPKLDPFIDNEEQQLFHCPECLLYQKGNLPDMELYENYYHTGYASRRESKTRTAMIRLGSVTKYLEPGPVKMLDVGCSIGATVEAGKRLGWEASGVDVSQAAVKYCKEQGLDCYVIDDERLPFEDNTFDVLASWHVIEHVTDVKATLAEWNRVLKPGGIMILETPESQCLKARRLGAEYAKFWPLGHLYTFTRSNMTSLLEKSGFDVLPSKVLGKLNALSPKMNAYALGYRSFRKIYRTFGLCKSIEVVSRKTGEPQVGTASLQRAA